MSLQTEKRQFSFSIDNILSHYDSKPKEAKYSPYKVDTTPVTPVTTEQSPLPSYGTEALDARLREYSLGK